MPRSRSETPSSPRRSRSPLSDHESDHERPNEYRVHIAELTPGIQESEIRKGFQRFGTVLDVWAASASCFAFVVYKYKEDAQKAIDQMDGRYAMTQSGRKMEHRRHFDSDRLEIVVLK